MGADERGVSPVALVTGANRGIRFEVCRQLARGGMKVWSSARETREGRAGREEALRGGFRHPTPYGRRLRRRERRETRRLV